MSDTATAPRPKPGILDIQAYVPGESSVPGGMTPIKLSSNETPLGASPKATAAYKAEADHLERYPDGASLALRKAIAAAYGLSAERMEALPEYKSQRPPMPDGLCFVIRIEQPDARGNELEKILVRAGDDHVRAAPLRAVREAGDPVVGLDAFPHE